MFKNKSTTGKSNVSGSVIRRLRLAEEPKMSQRLLAERMQLEGIDVDKNAIQRMESGQRFITDIELRTLCTIFKVSADVMLGL